MGQNERSWKGPKWVEIPLPAGVSGDVVAAVTESLTDEEKRVLGEYWAWFKNRRDACMCDTIEDGWRSCPSSLCEREDHDHA